MDLLGWTLTGLVAGAVMRWLRPGCDGTVLLVLLGIAGALLAAFLGRLAGLYGPDAPAGYAAALLGAALALALYRWIGRRPG